MTPNYDLISQFLSRIDQNNEQMRKWKFSSFLFLQDGAKNQQISEGFVLCYFIQFLYIPEVHTLYKKERRHFDVNHALFILIT